MIIGMPVSGIFSSMDVLGGWPSSFYLFGACGILWFIFWSTLIYETPKDHPYISAKELECFQEIKAETATVKNRNTLKAIFSSLPVWAVMIAHLGNDYGFTVFMAQMPTYFRDVLHLDILTNGFCQPFRFAGPGLCLLGIIASGCRPELILFLLCLAMFLNGFTFSGYNVTHVDMSPEFSGVLYGLTCTLATVGGIAGPTINGFITATGDSHLNWNVIFYITTAVYFVSGLFYAVFASAENQPWSEVESDINMHIKPDDKYVLKVQ
ncbi:vesicular glutamate transporter 3 [Caerostris extrusa]|uniref:Vesicular glutamate transporter 3 n=1 Tax=Caerostris extrusa TaxID=172846 RepID=A0AAV4WQ65_CAEEX|nr:vesicular glutamate transporter 3 [Caerostris extrusa]